jgi:hypothetical protein
MNRIRITLFKILFFSLFLLACKKENSNPTSQIKFINVSPYSANIDVTRNNELLIGNIGYGVPVNNYVSARSGSSNTLFSKTNTLINFLSTDISLTENRRYSAFLYDSASRMKISVVENNFTSIPPGKALIRFMHYLIGGQPVDILRTGATNPIFVNRSYTDHISNNSFSGYIVIDEGPFNCSVVLAGTNTLVSQFPSVEATAGKSYTLVLRGIANAGLFTEEYPRLIVMQD